MLRVTIEAVGDDRPGASSQIGRLDIVSVEDMAGGLRSYRVRVQRADQDGRPAGMQFRIVGDRREGSWSLASRAIAATGLMHAEVNL